MSVSHGELKHKKVNLEHEETSIMNKCFKCGCEELIKTKVTLEKIAK